MATSAQAISLTKRINRIEESATMAVAAEATRMRAQGVDVVDFSAGEPHFATPQHIKDAAIAAIQSNFTKYTPVGGVVELKDAIVARHKADFGSSYTREEVTAATGGKQALFNAFQVLVDHGDEVIIPVPYWVSFKDMVTYSGGVPVYVKTDEQKGFTLTADMVEHAVTPKTKVILLNSPSNPSGAVVSPEDLTAIVKMAAKKDIWVISDECYAYLDYTGNRFSLGSLPSADKDRLLVVGSLSKTYSMTGWRLGYALGPKPLISAMQKLQSQSTSNPTSIVQKAGIAALTGPQDCIKQMAAEYVQLRERMITGLRSIPGIQCQMPGGAFYAYPNVSAFMKDGTTATQIASRLLREAQVAVVPGEAFGTEQHIRLSYPTSMQNIDKGLERMKKFFENL